VRFANGPFLDIHSAESGRGVIVILEGPLEEAERLAAGQGWRAVAHRRDDAPAEARPPWSILAFRRGQGALSHLAVIDYEVDPVGYPLAEYDQPLLARSTAPTEGPRLARIEVGPQTGLADLACPELVLVDAEGVSRIVISGVTAPPLRIGPVEVVFER
jgi:hypothetical protein